MAIQLGSAYGKVELDASGVQKGVNTAKGALGELNTAAKTTGSVLQRAAAWVKSNAVAIAAFGDEMQTAGKKMTAFMSLPILGFFVLLVKKALDADTAMSRLAKESLGKLNEQLAILGEKFLPLLIKIVDMLVVMLDKFNNAPPAVQKMVVGLVALAALAGPITTLVGTITSMVGVLSTIGTTMTSLIPVIASLGTTLWAALAPLLPILALIAAVIVLVYLLWKNWDQLGVIIKQLAFIINYELKQALEGVKKSAGDFSTAWRSSLDTWKANFKQAQEINQKVQKLAGDAMLKVIVDFVAKTNAKLTELKNWATSTWNQIANGFMNAWSAIGNFFEGVKNSIVAGIQTIMQAVEDLIAALGEIVLPEDLTPGSPTPFEMGLRGIANTMRQLSQQGIPELNRSFALAQAARSPAYAMAGAGGGNMVTQNLYFPNGLTEKRVRELIDGRMESAFGKLSRMMEER